MMTSSELAALQEDMARTFTTVATIKRPVFGSDELGDDARPGVPAVVGTVAGWLSSNPTPQATLDGATVVTANTYRFDCAADADVRPRDWLVIGSNTYVVTDTTADESLPIALACTLRLRE